MSNMSTIITTFVKSNAAIRPHFFLTGPTGSGKTHAVLSTCEMLSVKVITINAAALTKEGVSGCSLSRSLGPLLNSGGKPTVCLVDEFDKLFINGDNESSLMTSQGVQDEFLKAVEGLATAALDYGKFANVDTTKVLFIFAGAFGGREFSNTEEMLDLGIRIEFIGRVPLLVALPMVTLESLQGMLKKSPLLADYLSYSKYEKTKVLKDLNQRLIEVFSTNSIGARIVNSLIHQYFIEKLEIKGLRSSSHH
jgi:ATP-dependent protease Clp ATPase subunit